MGLDSNLPMTLFTYRIRFDSGLAPNPYWGSCTLAVCKPVIRRIAQQGDLVVALGAKTSRDGRDHEGTLVCAMRVDEVVPWLEYDERFPEKRPEPTSNDWRRWAGNSLYDFSSGKPIQRKGMHSPADQSKDLSERNVLVSRRFLHFGSIPILVSDSFSELVSAGPRGHHPWQDDREREFHEWLSALPYRWNTPLGLPQCSPLHWMSQPTIVPLMAGRPTPSRQADYQGNG